MIKIYPGVGNKITDFNGIVPKAYLKKSEYLLTTFGTFFNDPMRGFNLSSYAAAPFR
jgi:hypothetical protein